MARPVFKYCPLCTGILRQARIEGRKRRVCPECGWVHYQNPLPCAAAFVRDKKGRVLLVQRAVEPGKGEWALPSGFIEIEETPEEACLRELREETGLTGRIVETLGSYSQSSVLYKNVIIIGYLVEAQGKIKPGSDSMKADYYSPEKLPDIAFPSHRAIVRDGLKVRNR